MLRVEQITKPLEIGPVLQLMAHATREEIPFSPEDFTDWAGRCIKFSTVLVGVGYDNEKPIGFFIAFAPFELDHVVFVNQAYVLPEYRTGEVLKRGLYHIRSWGKMMWNTEKLAINTKRPRAWKRLLGNGTSMYVRVEG